MKLKTSVALQGKRREFSPPDESSKVAAELYKALTDIQLEKAEDPKGWVYHVA